MSQKTSKPPEPLVFFLALVATVGVFLLFMDGGARIAGIAMILIGVGGIVVRKMTSKPESHADLRTSGADRGKHSRK